MMASVILVVGFIGMISALTIGSEMLATARRSTLATQIINHELEKLRLSSWANMPATGTASVTIDTRFTSTITAVGLVSGTTITLSRTTTDVTTDLKEVAFTVTWTKGGTTTAATTTAGSWLSRLAFNRESPISRTYTRSSFGYYGKYGLNLNVQRS
jgi:hypothetical protein